MLISTELRRSRMLLCLFLFGLLRSCDAWLVPLRSSLVLRTRSHQLNIRRQSASRFCPAGLSKLLEIRAESHPSGPRGHRGITGGLSDVHACCVIGGEGGGETSSFEQWKEFFLRNNLADPTTAATSWERQHGNKQQTMTTEKPRQKQMTTMTEEEKAYTAGDTDTPAYENNISSTSINISRNSRSTINSQSAENAAKSSTSATTHTGATAGSVPSRYHAAIEIMESRGETDTAAAHRAYLLLANERADSAARTERAKGATGSPEDTPPSSDLDETLLTKLTAGALLSWIRCATDGNGLVVTDNGRPAIAETPERKELWAEHAPKVLRLVKEVGVDPASDPELQHIVAEAIMYSLSSKGILEAFASGETFAYTSAVKVLLDKYPRYDNGVAFILNGAYYLAAPWPIRSPAKASRSFEKALEVSKRSRRNNYYAALGRLACGDRRGARERFQTATGEESCDSESLSEKDVAVMLRENSQKGLEICSR